MRHISRPAVLIAVLIAVWPRPSAAQTAPPTLQRVSPAGASRGTQVTLTLTGTNIADATRLIFSEPGITSRIAAIRELPVEKRMTPKGVIRTDAPIEDGARRFEVTVAVSIARSVTHGVHAFRVETPLGVSNAMRFAVSALPETPERAPNGPATPQAVTLPAVLAGTLERPGEIDAYAFSARPGEELVFEVVARPFGSRLDSVIRIAGGDGRTLAESNDYGSGRDSLLVWKVPDTRTYTLLVEDAEHGGSESHRYRIHAGQLPYITDVFPLGIAGPGGEVAVAGANLGGTQRVRVDGSSAARARRDRLTALLPTAAGSPLNRRTIALGRYPESAESEPNDAAAEADDLPIPATVNGRIWRRTQPAASDPSPGDDADLFRFSARKGQALIFEVQAQRLGSTLDSIVEVLDASGRPVPRALVRCVARTELTLNDPDSSRRSMRLATWNEIAINDYLMIGDEILQVESLPTHPDADLDFVSYRGTRTTLLDTSTRNHSVGDAVYKVEIHPPGTDLPPNGMPVFQVDYVNDDGGTRYGGKDSRLHFEAPEDGVYLLRVRDVRGLGGEPFAYRLTAREPAPDFSLTFEPGSFNVPRGGRVSLSVTADRIDGYNGAIDVQVLDLPRGLRASSGRIPEGADTTTLFVEAAADASLAASLADLEAMDAHAVQELPRRARASGRLGPAHRVPGVATLRVIGRAVIAGAAAEREARTMEPVPVVALAPAPDLTVTTDAERLELRPGQEVALTVRVQRHNGFSARVPLSVLNLPHGVEVTDIGLNGIMITEAETSRTIHIRAEPWVRAASVPILVVGRVEVNSPLRNEAAALPVDLVIAAPASAGR